MSFISFFFCEVKEEKIICWTRDWKWQWMAANENEDEKKMIRILPDNHSCVSFHSLDVPKDLN